ncbi:glutathione S-transferase [Xylogone sp. PMI_703]|nr:glutathione S-transferase [Xylogone sp. PMI_703]
MQFFFLPHTCALAVHIALCEAQLDTQLKKIRRDPDAAALKLQDDDSEYLTINPNGKVPAIEFPLEKGKILTETQTILQYIAWELAPDKLPIPQTGAARWRALELLNFITTELHKGFAPLFRPDLSPSSREFFKRELGKAFTYLQGVIAEQDETGGDGKESFILGDEFTVVDCYAWAVLTWTTYFDDIDLSPWPTLVEYRRRILKRPSVRKALKEEGVSLEF